MPQFCTGNAEAGSVDLLKRLQVTEWFLSLWTMFGIPRKAEHSAIETIKVD
jgi:hypothetical protein